MFRDCRIIVVGLVLIDVCAWYYGLNWYYTNNPVPMGKEKMATIASILLSAGMMMLPPVMISLPFKLILFILIDGWGILAHSLSLSFK